jgi:hypothetical protein
MSASKEFGFAEDGGQDVFRATIETGTEAQGKGFYHATIDLHYLARGTDATPWLALLLGDSRAGEAGPAL